MLCNIVWKSFQEISSPYNQLVGLEIAETKSAKFGTVAKLRFKKTDFQDIHLNFRIELQKKQIVTNNLLIPVAVVRFSYDLWST